MSLLKPHPLYTVDQYLAMERAAEERHVFVDGEVRAMAGESGEHGDISANLVGLLVQQLKGTRCRARTKDTKVRSGPTLMSGQSIRGMFSYPDLVVICGDPEYPDAHRDIILNPTVIIEVLSKSTEAFDRGEKFTRYQEWNPTLTDYLLVSQDRVQVEHYTRQTDRKWSYDRHTGRAAEVSIPSIGCVLRLADVYDRVHIADETEPNAAAP
jgi:Uma2 family endonuclease